MRSLVVAVAALLAVQCVCVAGDGKVIDFSVSSKLDLHITQPYGTYPHYVFARRGFGIDASVKISGSDHTVRLFAHPVAVKGAKPLQIKTASENPGKDDWTVEEVAPGGASLLQESATTEDVTVTLRSDGVDPIVRKAVLEFPALPQASCMTDQPCYQWKVTLPGRDTFKCWYHFPFEHKAAARKAFLDLDKNLATDRTEITSSGCDFGIKFDKREIVSCHLKRTPGIQCTKQFVADVLHYAAEAVRGDEPDGEPDSDQDEPDVSQGEKTFHFRITAPVTAGVGRYLLYAEVLKSNQRTDHYFLRQKGSDKKTYLVIWFNPWHPDDTVAMKKPDESIDVDALDEYVLNSDTRMHRSRYSSASGSGWSVDQFTLHSIEAAIRVLEISAMSLKERGDPVICSRYVARAVWNGGKHGDGIIGGRWISGSREEYCADITGKAAKHCRSPLEWTGTGPILRSWFENDFEQVHWAQCWVFSGVTTTLMRTLGIPARSVINIGSAHEHCRENKPKKFNGGKIPFIAECDFFRHLEGYSLKATKEEKRYSDSIWNFHAWNHVWMKRPDLGGGKYDGWQGVDATNQEHSVHTQRQYFMGPASLRAVGEADAGFNADGGTEVVPYDTTFLRSEVTSAKAIYVKKADGSYEKSCTSSLSRTQAGVGQFVFAKKIGVNSAENLNTIYDGTAWGRTPTSSYLQEGGDTQDLDGQYCDITVRMTEEIPETVKVPDDYKGKVTLKKMGQDKRTAVISLKAFKSDYTGDVSEQTPIWEKELTSEVKGELVVDVVIPMSVYAEKAIKEGAEFFKVEMVAVIEETKVVLTADANVEIVLPELEIALKSQKIQLFAQSSIDATWKNPLPFTLEDVEVEVELTGQEGGAHKVKGLSIPAGGSFHHTFSIKSNRKGSFGVSATLTASNMPSATGASDEPIEVELDLVEAISAWLKKALPSGKATGSAQANGASSGTEQALLNSDTPPPEGQGENPDAPAIGPNDPQNEDVFFFFIQEGGILEEQLAKIPGTAGTPGAVDGALVP